MLLSVSIPLSDVMLLFGLQSTVDCLLSAVRCPLSGPGHHVLLSPLCQNPSAPAILCLIYTALRVSVLVWRRMLTPNAAIWRSAYCPTQMTGLSIHSVPAICLLPHPSTLDPLPSLYSPLLPPRPLLPLPPSSTFCCSLLSAVDSAFRYLPSTLYPVTAVLQRRLVSRSQILSFFCLYLFSLRLISVAAPIC
jgi:hypothetical protein